MQADDHRTAVARVDDVQAHVLAGADGVERALGLLGRAEQAAGIPLVDESERARLEALAAGRVERSAHWHSVLARRGQDVVGYAGLVLGGPDDPSDAATGDVAVDRAQRSWEAVLQVLLEALDVLGQHHDVAALQVWLRHASEADLDRAATAGYTVERRLGVLSRPLDAVAAGDVPDGIRIAGFTDADADQVVDVLAAAYAGTPDGGWTREQFDEIRGYAWFEPADLRVARDGDDRIVGVHWTKRRGEGVGEVYNLAVHPQVQGGRLGAALLHAGLAHLREAGCHEVMLWVDLVNERAVALYTSQGFEVAWQDVALGRRPAASDQSAST